MRITRVALACMLGGLLATTASAVTATWTGGGGDGKWKTAGNWARTPAGIPLNNDTITVAGGAVQYIPTDAPIGDLAIAPGGSLTIGSGGKVYQPSGGAWMQLGGTVTVNGGELDSGTAGQVNVNGLVAVSSGVFRVRSAIGFAGGASLHLAGGTTYKTGNFEFSATQCLFEGGTLEFTSGEFQNNTGITVPTGTIRTPMLSPRDSASIITLTGGHIIVTGWNWNGYYQNGTYINFSETSTGMVTFTNCTPAQVYAKYFGNDLPNPKIRLGGVVVSAPDMTNFFNFVESSVPGMGNSVDISLKQTEAGAATFLNSACAASGLTSTSVVITATIDDPGSPAADVYACYSTVNGLLNFGNWQNRVLLGTAQSAMPYSSAPSLAPDSVYFYRMAATNGTGIAFATPSPTFVMTAPVGVSAPVSLPENSVAPASIVISRPAANNCSAVALSVPFTLGGTATLGTHYTLSTTSPATIPASSDSVSITLTPLADWANSTNRTVQVTLLSSLEYLAPTNGTATVTLLDAVLPSFPTNAFMGTLSTDSTVAGNWSLGVVPAASHVVVFSPEYAQRQLSWNPGSASTVAGWRQPYAFSDPSSAVTFHTTPTSPLTITGDCVLNGGYWIHNGPAADPTNAVAVTIQGNLTIGAGAQINAGNGVLNQANGARRGYYLAGPGYLPSVGDAGTGSSFGGEGATNDITYGSILNTLDYGSSGRGDGPTFAGGGLIILNVSGTTTLNGSILSQGFGYTGTGRGASTGGSINLTTGSLLGNGTIGANGGRDLNYGSGSGGRIRVKLTDVGASFDDFAGTLTAYGNDGFPGSAAGTITLQTAADSPATALVIVDNTQFPDSTNTPSRAMCTHLPPKTQTDASLAGTSWVLRDYASVRLTGNTKLASLSVEGSTPRIFTETYTVTTKAFVVDGVSVTAGTYTAEDYPALLHGNGAVVVTAQGTIFLVR